jgi:DNA-damage-inducible protein J
MMMAKSAMLNVRLEPEIKRRAERIYKAYGLTLTDAVTMFLHKSILTGGVPFDLREPALSAESQDAMDEARGILNGTIKNPVYHSVDALFDSLLSEDDA